MRQPDPITEICDYDIAALRALLPAAGDPVWDEMEFRQRALRFQNATRSIVFEWLNNDWRPGTEPKVETMTYAPAELTAAAYACANTLATHRSGRIAKLMLAELGPRAEIGWHYDQAPALARSHRCHVPILTNDAVRFTVDDKLHVLAPGKAYELDNTRWHAVVNGGAERRVHLICDFLP